MSVCPNGPSLVTSSYLVKKTVNQIVSVLEIPLQAEFINTVKYLHCIPVCYEATTNFKYPNSVKVIIEEKDGRRTDVVHDTWLQTHWLEMARAMSLPFYLDSF